MLSPERDNYRFLVLWEELGDIIRLDEEVIVDDRDSCSTCNGEEKAPASADADAHAYREAEAANQAKTASRARENAAAEAASEKLRHRFFSVQEQLSETHRELQRLRLRLTAAVSNVEVSTHSSSSCAAFAGGVDVACTETKVCHESDHRS